MISKKNFLQALVGRKKLHAAQMKQKKNSCTAASKKKKCCKAISSFQGDFTKSQQNCNHSSLAPFKLWSWLCFRMCNAFLALQGPTICEPASHSSQPKSHSGLAKTTFRLAYRLAYLLVVFFKCCLFLLLINTKKSVLPRILSNSPIKNHRHDCLKSPNKVLKQLIL